MFSIVLLRILSPTSEQSYCKNLHVRQNYMSISNVLMSILTDNKADVYT